MNRIDRHDSQNSNPIIPSPSSHSNPMNPTTPISASHHFRRGILHKLLQHPFIIILRCLLASILALFLAPFLAPALTQTLPSCLPIRLYECLAVYLLSLVASLAALDVHMRPRHTYRHSSFLPSPLVTMWASPMPGHRSAVTYDQPGRWMTDSQLHCLLGQLEIVANSSIGQVPTHRLFDRERVRHVMKNRVICVISDAKGPLGFTAMTYLHVPGDVIVHLGLTMIGQRGRSKRLQTTLCTKCVLMAVVNLARFSYHVTNIAASPAGIGNVCEYFFDCYPSYEITERRQHHVVIARHVLEMYRYEFGCSDNAWFDERRFVVHGSNEKDGGGTHQFIKADGEPVSKHRLEICNKFVGSLIDFPAGDELFQVASFNFLGSLVKYVFAPKHRRSRSARLKQ